jgi:hypothetical protein
MCTFFSVSLFVEAACRSIHLGIGMIKEIGRRSTTRKKKVLVSVFLFDGGALLLVVGGDESRPPSSSDNNNKQPKISIIYAPKKKASAPKKKKPVPDRIKGIFLLFFSCFQKKQLSFPFFFGLLLAVALCVFIFFLLHKMNAHTHTRACRRRRRPRRPSPTHHTTAPQPPTSLLPSYRTDRVTTSYIKTKSVVGVGVPVPTRPVAVARGGEGVPGVLLADAVTDPLRGDPLAPLHDGAAAVARPPAVHEAVRVAVVEEGRLACSMWGGGGGGGGAVGRE